MSYTFKEFRDIVAPYAGQSGKASDDKEVSTFARKVMEYLLISGSEAAIRKVVFNAQNGLFALPQEVETPLKVKFDNTSVEVWNKWVEFYSDTRGFDSCAPLDSVIAQDQASPLIYDLPRGGSIVGVEGTCEEGSGKEPAFITVQGKDNTGREVYTFHNGKKIAGEKLTIKKDQTSFGRVTWGTITGVTKPVTNGYVRLYAVTPAANTQSFLADWSPSTTRPYFRRWRIVTHCNPIVKVSMLCRVRLKDTYLDNELTLFENQVIIMRAAQALQAEESNDINLAAYKNESVVDFLDKEAGYKKSPGRPVDVYAPLSGGSVRNVTGRR